MLRVDLDAAGIPFLDNVGRRCDFHALRHTFITSLTRSGVHPKIAQVLARHSDISLTMDRYTHVVLESQKDAVEGMPSLDAPSSEDALRATGTDGTVGKECLGVLLAVTGDKTGDNMGHGETELMVEQKAESAHSDSETGALTAFETDSGAGTRTPDTRIMIPLL